ncbi:ABC transporter ATP-binding protein [Ideonella azotifigens]|uniref:ABC transporter ATP-binding protein n=1 Tax=Ideonella azotifigens TaxID=513160 RepID=A0ABN1JN53_9BURK|nr:ABC transporter ATP-binding protein [Ideonella azotifigens]MCD2339905.1 ABC transporter ATP-binding protein [Ideonella azotifigens]
MSKPEPLLQIDVRRHAFGERCVLQGIRTQVQAGEIVAIVGASGCGKSTLLRIVAGLETGFEGRITLAGQPQHGLSREIGFIFQEPRLFPWLTVAENVAFDIGRRGAGDPRVAELLAEVGLDGLGGALPKQLSGGQAQRVAIARGLFSQPRVLLLDEPFSAVDAFTRMRLQDLLLGLARRHASTLLLVTHDIDEAAYLADRVWVLDSQPGRLSADIEVPLSRPRARDGAALAQSRAEVLHALQAVRAI